MSWVRFSVEFMLAFLVLLGSSVAVGAHGFLLGCCGEEALAF
jgi:hypothetical protein